jgi:uncharacterized protein (DUF1810 family)
MMKVDPLQRFLDAQNPIYAEVLAELSAGRKASHWMWFVFPQHVALGTSDRAKRYGLYGVEQAREFLAHPVLGQRLLQCCALMKEHASRSAVAILGEVDALKFCSCLTLFASAAPSEPIFTELLELFYSGQPDPLTLNLIQAK